MPVIITKDSVDYYLVPSPLVTFNKTVQNNVGRPGLGSEYSISLEGTLIQTHGNPYYSGGIADFSTDSWTTTPEVEDEEITVVDADDLLDATIKKQEKIRSLFTNPVVSGVAKPIKVTIRGWDTENEGSGLIFNAFVDDVNFPSEGRWANPNPYTISLRNANFLSSSNSAEFPSFNDESSADYQISSLSQSFTIQEDAQKTLTFDGNYSLQHVNKVYTINRQTTIVGSPVYDEVGEYVSGLAPWQQASGFLYQHLGVGSGQLPETKSEISSLLGSSYNVANTVYIETPDEEAGSYALNETYLAYSGASPVIETINISEDQGESEQKTLVVQGSIQGLDTNDGFQTSGNAYIGAAAYWDTVSSGNPPDAYHYAAAVLPSSGWLHPKPLSRSVGRDLNNGVITYTYTFDDRPPNMIPNSVSESIVINDTYPGEIFSVTPIIGASQPVLQYLNSRSEYRRSLSINVVMGAATPTWNTTLGTDVNNSGVLDSGNINSVMQSLLLSSKPSVTNAEEFNLIYNAANPVNDPNFSVVTGQCFHSAPRENWDPRTRSYTYSVEWTYKRDL